MANITCKELIDGVQQTQLNDVEKITYTEALLLSALNQALVLLVLVRPDASAAFHTLACAEGTRQVLPADGLRLLKVVRNIKPDGKPGRIVNLVNQHDLDAADPDWHSGTPKQIIKEYMFDERSPTSFYIYPPAIEGTKLDIEYSKHPGQMTSLQQELPVSDIYRQPLQEFILYKLLSGEGGQGQGMQHYNNGMALLGGKVTGDRYVAPVTQLNPATGVGS